jgi:hypothetical protein
MRARAAPALPLLAAAGVALVVAVGVALTLTRPERAFGSWLGAPWPPFFAFWRPRAGPAALGAVLALAAGVPAGLRLARMRGRASPAVVAAGLFALALGLQLVLALARGGGAAAWTAPYASGFERVNEYLTGVPVVDGLGLHAFLDRFAELSPTLPLHATAHPPGLLVLLHLAGIHTPAGNAALTIGAGALAAPLTYAFGRAVAGEDVARRAGLLFVFAPAALLYGATSADALFAALATAAAAALAARRRALRALGPPLLAVASFFSYALLAVGLWAVILAARRDGLRAAAGLAAACAVTVVAFYAALWAWTGFDVVGALRAADAAYRSSIYLVRPYWFWLVGSPAAFLVAMGLPTAWLALRGAGRGHDAAVAFAATVAAAAVLGFAKAETERIWLFLVPLGCVAAARVLPGRRVGLVLGLLAAQALAVELLFDTIW